MTSTLRPIRHEDRLSLVEHLDELRTRLIICVTAFVICFGVCLWQDDVILDIINRALEAENNTVREQYELLAAQNRAVAKSVPPEEARRPVTLGVGEPFTATVRVAAYAALLLALPLLLFQAYAFVLPAFSREERSVALPLMAMVPFLFLSGVVFAYFMVLPNA